MLTFASAFAGGGTLLFFAEFIQDEISCQLLKRAGIVDKSNETDNIQDVKQLEEGIVDLIHLCLRLREENNALRMKQTVLLAERSDLIGRHETARNKVESIISRLNDMEHQA